MFCAGYIGYVLSEMLDFSGIITLFTSGIMLIHYAFYNCSERTRSTINLSFGTIGFGAEAFVFAYVGTSVFSYKSYDWSYQLIAFEFAFVLISRFTGSVLMFYATSAIFWVKRGLKFQEVLFINFAGIIRGAIAFGLVLRLEPGLENRSVIITTVLTLVITTTIIFGATMTLLKTALLETKVHPLPTTDQEMEEEKKEMINYRLDVREPLITNNLEVADNLEVPARASFTNSYTENKFSNSNYNINEMFHDEKYKNQHACVKYWKRFDEFIMKPLLIFEYAKLSKEKKRPHIVDE
jgi:hypothetical protein